MVSNACWWPRVKLEGSIEALKRLQRIARLAITWCDKDYTIKNLRSCLKYDKFSHNCGVVCFENSSLTEGFRCLAESRAIIGELNKITTLAQMNCDLMPRMIQLKHTFEVEKVEEISWEEMTLKRKPEETF